MWGTDELGFLSRYDGLSCVRLTGLGAFSLDLGDSPEPTVAPTVSRVTILPTLDIVADRGRFDPDDEPFLSIFCVRRGEGFALDRATALAAIEKGHRASDLPAFWRRPVARPSRLARRRFSKTWCAVRRPSRSRVMPC